MYKINVCRILARIFPLGSLEYSKPTNHNLLMVEAGTLCGFGEKPEANPEKTWKNFLCRTDDRNILSSLLHCVRIEKPIGSRVTSGFKTKLCNPWSCYLEDSHLISAFTKNHSEFNSSTFEE